MSIFFPLQRTCPDCGVTVYHRDSRRKRCAQCWAAGLLERGPVIKECEGCGQEFTHENSLRRLCSPCREFRANHRSLFASPPGNQNEIARKVTKYAVKVGFLPHPTLFACSDCKAQAECYDHRDYTKPLDVEPVCRSCNSSRGRGIPLLLGKAA